MAVLAVTGVDVCAGSGHITVSYTVDGRPDTVMFSRGDFARLNGREKNLAQERVSSDIKEATLENGTQAQLRTRLIGRPFRI